MPLTGDIAEELCNADPDAKADLAAFGGDFEAWLTYLSTRQPWETETDTLLNRARFLRIAADVAEIVRKLSKGADAADAVARELLTRQVLEWRSNKAQILTFNYDLIIENELVEREGSLDWAQIYPLPLTSRSPHLSGQVVNSASHDTMHLHKLHGSLNWLYPASAQGGGPLTITPTPHEPLPPDESKPHLYGDLTTMVIPPTSEKVQFYSDVALRALWQDAAKRLRETDELVVIGYSFPPSDQQITSLIRTSLKPDSKIHIVNPDTETFKRAKVLFAHHQVDHTGDAMDYAKAHTGQVIQRATDAYDPQNSSQPQIATIKTPEWKIRGTLSYACSGSEQRDWFDADIKLRWPSSMSADKFADSRAGGERHLYIPYSDWERAKTVPDSWQDGTFGPQQLPPWP